MKRERPNEEAKRDYCNFLASYLDSVYELQTIEEQANALFGVLEYMIYDLEPQELSGGAAILFKMARPVIDRTIRKQTANRENGKKPKRSQLEAKRSQLEAKRSQLEANSKPTRSKTNPEKEKDKEKDKDKGYRREENAHARELPPVHNSITLEWIRYREEQGKPLTNQQISGIDRQIEKAIREHGEQAVIDLVTTCITSGYREVYFDRLEKKPKEKQLCGFDALIAMEEAATGEVYSPPIYGTLTDNNA